jgi:hypothetical protein
MLTIGSFADGVDEIAHVLKKHGKLTPTSLANAKKVFRGFLGTERTIQKAAEATIERIKRDVAAIQKSEAEAVAAVTSNAFDAPPTQAQRDAAETSTLVTHGVAARATRQLQTWGIKNPSDVDYERAIEAVLNVAVINNEGENGITIDHSNPQLAASMRERGDGTIWEPIDMASERERDMVDEAMASAVVSNFQGLRNQMYRNPPRSEMGATNFSGTGGASVAAGTNEGATVSDQKIQAIAQAAYAAGVAAGSSNFAKRAARRSR